MESIRSKKITSSSTFVINKKVNELRKKGIDVINFGLGESHFKIHKIIKDEAIKAIKNDKRRYTRVEGADTLRDAIAKYLTKYNLRYGKNDIIVDAGSKHIIFSLMLALADPGDEIILQAPYWLSYYDQAKLAQLKIKILKTNEESNFKIDPDELDKTITKKTRMFILNSPNNPAGIVYKKKELEKIAEVIVDNRIYIISDEIYSEFTYYGKHVSIASLNEEIEKLAIVTGGASKSYAIGGWRLGFAASKDKEVVSALEKIISNTTSCAPIISQMACAKAFSKINDSYVKKWAKLYKKNGEYIYKCLSKLDGMKCVKPEGAYYIFPNISCFFGKKYKNKLIKNAEDFCSLLLEEGRVATLPGGDFGIKENFRIAYGISHNEVIEGCKRIVDFVNKIR